MVGVRLLVPLLAAAVGAGLLAGGDAALLGRPAIGALSRPTGALARLAIEGPRGSLSCGAANHGALIDARALAAAGTAFVVPEPWRMRGRRYATRELIDLIGRAARRVDRLHPGSVLAVADLSAERGGRISGHRSHQSGRDADLLYYARTDDGRPYPPDAWMPIYRADGRAERARAPLATRDLPPRRFDLPRNWALVRALIDDREVAVDRIFVSRRIRRWLLRYAELIGEPAERVARAAEVLARVGHADSHDDHMHVRIACSAGDAAGGCVDRMAPRGAPRTAPLACPATAAHDPAIAVADLAPPTE